LTGEPGLYVLAALKGRTVTGWLLVAGQLMLLAAILLGPRGAAWPVPPEVRVLFTIVAIAGGAMIVWGARALGANITPHPAPVARAELRTGGPFRLVRHPIYSGILALAFGVAGASGGAFKLIAYGLLVLLLSVKARFEEKLLTERFPAYAEYARRTPRFVPTLRRPRD
jgi:protein-S-isoprenylcysteine O-methyltransferase Ste14